MRALVLAAGRSMARARVEEITEILQRAGGPDLEIDLYSWGPVETPVATRSTTVLGPVKVYTPPAPATGVMGLAHAPSRSTAGPGADDDSSPDSDDDDSDDVSGLRALSAQITPARVNELAQSRIRRQIRRIRRSARYKRVRRIVRGGLNRQFATRARKDPDLLDRAGKSQLVLALDAAAVPAAWRIARRTPGPAVVLGLPAAERELRTLNGTSLPTSH